MCTLGVGDWLIAGVAAVVDVRLLVERLRPLVEAIAGRAETPDRTPQPVTQLEPCVRLPGWTEVAALLECAHRHETYAQAGYWALEMLHERLGEDWLRRAVSKSDDGFPLALNLLGSHVLALAEALEWAIRLDLSGDWDGGADMLRDLRRDPRTARLLHTRAQLTVAAAASRLGWPVELEPSGENRRPADVKFSTPAGTAIAEIRVLTQSMSARERFALSRASRNG